MLIQGCKFAEGLLTEIALVSFDTIVPCFLGGLVAGGARPGEKLLRDNSIGITTSDSLIKLVTVKRSFRTRATL